MAQYDRNNWATHWQGCGMAHTFMDWASADKKKSSMNRVLSFIASIRISMTRVFWNGYSKYKIKCHNLVPVQQRYQDSCKASYCLEMAMPWPFLVATWNYWWRYPACTVSLFLPFVLYGPQPIIFFLDAMKDSYYATYDTSKPPYSMPPLSSPTWHISRASSSLRFYPLSNLLRKVILCFFVWTFPLPLLSHKMAPGMVRNFHLHRLPDTKILTASTAKATSRNALVFALASYSRSVMLICPIHLGSSFCVHFNTICGPACRRTHNSQAPSTKSDVVCL